MKIFQPTITGSFIVTGSATVTGSLIVSSGITGSLQGTATTASYVLQAVSSSYSATSSIATSASFATTASFALNAGGGGSGAGFPFTGDASISGSLIVTGSAAAAAPFHVLSGSTSLLYVSRSGNIGIGTINPIYKLDVNGTGRFTSALTADSTIGAAGTLAASGLTETRGINILTGPSVSNVLATYYYYLTNNGSVTAADRTISINANATAAGNNHLWIGLAMGYSFSRSNSSAAPIIRASIQATNYVDTAASESADMIFLTKPGSPANTAMTERMRILGDSRILYTSAYTATTTSQSYFQITGSITQVQTASAQIYGVNITPTMIYTTGSQTHTALRVTPTFSGSTAFTSSQQNIIADFGATSVGTQFSVNDVTSGSIYMVNDVSGLPIIEALSDWTVNMYNYPTRVFQKTGSSIIISGSLVVAPSGSFVLPLTASTSPATGSAYWSGSLLFIWNGSRYMSASLT